MGRSNAPVRTDHTLVDALRLELVTSWSDVEGRHAAGTRSGDRLLPGMGVCP